MKRKIFAISLLLAGLFWSCEDKIVDNEIEEGIRVEIVSPTSDGRYTYYTAIQFKANLLNNNDTLSYDKVEWTSDIFGRINTYKPLEPGSHLIECTITKDSILYFNKVKIFVKNSVIVDTLLNNNKLQLFTIPNTDIYTIAVDKEDKLILGGKPGLFYQENGCWKNINYDDGLLGYEIQSIGVSNDNIIHFGYMFTNGITKQQGSRWVNIEMNQPFENDVHNIAFDENNNLWAALHNGIITQYLNNSWKTFEDQPSRLYHPNSLFFDNNQTLWGATSGGCFFYDGQNWNSILINNEPLISWEFARADDGTMWSLHSGDLYKITSSDTTLYRNNDLGFNLNYITNIEVDLNNNLWLATINGIIKFDGTNYELISLPVTEKYIRDIAIDTENTIWFGGQNVFGSYKEN